MVSAAELSRYREHVRIPAEVVRAVVEVPFGAHPSGHHHFPHRGEEWGYAEDRPFIMEARRASRSAEAYRAWLDEWILGCPDHQSYLAKLGQERLFALKAVSYTHLEFRCHAPEFYNIRTDLVPVSYTHLRHILVHQGWQADS